MRKKLWTLIASVLPLLTLAQDSTEIYLFNLSVSEKGVVLSGPRNISNHKGYDNQPHFHPAAPLLYFSSKNDDNKKTDIKEYHLGTGKLASFTLTPEEEFSPTVTPGRDALSCIILRDNKVQDLARYPFGGGSPTVLVNTLKVGYHAWINDHQLLLFVLKDSVTNELHHYNLRTREDKVIAPAPARSLHKIPGEEAMSFIEKSSSDKWTLKRLDVPTGRITTISDIPPKEDITWTQNGLVLQSNDNEIRVYNPKTGAWSRATIEGMPLKKITRMAVSPANDKIAVVAAD